MEESAKLCPEDSTASVALVVLNYNGRGLLQAYLPSVVAAAARSRHACQVWVLDNASNDDSLAWLAAHHPRVQVWRAANLGLASYNDLLAHLRAPVAVLLNNDIGLDAGAVDPLVGPLIDQLPQPACQRHWFMTAPACWLEDGTAYEGFRTAVTWRWGLVQATARFPGYASGIGCRGPTASAGAVMAVDRESFLRLGGFDPRYTPGRLEDLDLCYRAFLAGQECLYVPEAVVWHRGQATFDAELGSEPTLALALRNTLLFQWKHLRHPWHVLRFWAAQPLRLAYDWAASPLREPAARWRYTRALVQAWQRQRRLAAEGGTRTAPAATEGVRAREREFFRRFAPRTMQRLAASSQAMVPARRGTAALEATRQTAATLLVPGPTATSHSCASHADASRRKNYPLSRWWLLPLAGRVAVYLEASPLRPWHVSVAGLIAAAGAAGFCLAQPTGSLVAGLLLLAAWFCDRLDGQLARRQQRQTPRGAWLDANLDELADVLVHAAAAVGLAHATSSVWPWAWLAVFLSGKYLLIYGLAEERALGGGGRAAGPWKRKDQVCRAGGQTAMWRLARAVWHMPANADVRAHLAAAALASGLMMWELAVVGLYYHLRWAVRYGLVLRRLGGVRPAEVQG